MQRGWRPRLDRRLCEQAGERGEQLAVPRIREQFGGGPEAEPADGADLVARLRLAPDHRHGPVADDLRPALAVVVGGGRQLEVELTAEPGLLLHLAEGALPVGLARLELALGEGPVSPLATIDE